MNLVEKQPDIDEIYLYAKDLYEEKYQYLISIHKKGLKRFNDLEAFIEYSNYMEKFIKILMNTVLKVPKDVRLNTTHFFISKIPNKRELWEVAINHSSDIKTEDFINIYRECTAEPYSFLVNDTTLASDNPLRFRKNLFNI